MNRIPLTLALVLLAATTVVACRTEADPDANAMALDSRARTFWDLRTHHLLGGDAPLSAYRGQVALVVNVASACGLTPQYRGLEELHRELGPRGFTVLAFPSNDFGGQEPGTPEEIRAFCDERYDVTFPIFEKVVTKAGPGQSPVYAHLGFESGSLPDWNFGKYVIGRDGEVLAYFPPKTPPDDPKLREAIEAALG